jgi:YHS domain-containing protein
MDFRRTTAIVATVLLVSAVAGVGCKRPDSARGAATTTTETDPVCGMAVPTNAAVATRMHQGHTYYFCSEGCAQDFDKDPDRYTVSKSKPQSER